MNKLITLAALAVLTLCSLGAQQISVVPLIPKPTDARFSLFDRGVRICSVLHNGTVLVSQGNSQACWLIAVAEHNKHMNDSDHVAYDVAIERLAAKFGKPLVHCAKENPYPREWVAAHSSDTDLGSPGSPWECNDPEYIKSLKWLRFSKAYCRDSAGKIRVVAGDSK